VLVVHDRSIRGTRSFIDQQRRGEKALTVRIGREIRRRRECLAWTLEDLSHRSGLSSRYISNLENDRRDPSLSTIVAVAKALGAEPGELLGVRTMQPSGFEAAELFARLHTDAQRVVLHLMRLLGPRRRK
jgi:transcriptional regulator with XRE-family HTH domain